MGCDIHVAIERKVGDKWVMVNRCHHTNHIEDRHYKRFAALAGVRGDGPEAKGVPDDISESTKLFIDEWSGDGHSHSWNTVEDAIRICNSALYEGDKPFEYPAYKLFGLWSDDDLGSYRIVYFFDN